uniref:Uncharacterized protein n=1 Tax=Rhizophora mucronata TaxID=61149 RepID=A0A2P2P7K2_RHIMU
MLLVCLNELTMM